MKLRSLALAGAMALACALPAAAQTSATLPVKDNSGTVRQIAGQQDAASAFHYRDIMEGLTSGGAPDPLVTDGSGHVLTVLFGQPATNLASLAAANGSPTDAASVVTNATAASEIALLKGLILTLNAPAQAGGKIDTVIASASVNRGASFTSAAAVTIMPANASRRGVAFQNQGSSNCYESGVATATADFNSLLIPAGGLYESGPQHAGTGAISVICPSATTSAPVPVYAREF